MNKIYSRKPRTGRYPTYDQYTNYFLLAPNTPKRNCYPLEKIKKGGIIIEL